MVVFLYLCGCLANEKIPNAELLPNEWSQPLMKKIKAFICGFPKTTPAENRGLLIFAEN